MGRNKKRGSIMGRIAKLLLTVAPLILLSVALSAMLPEIRRYLRMKEM